MALSGIYKQSFLEFSKTKTVLTMSATLVDAIVRVVGKRGSRSTVVSVINVITFVF